MATETIVMIALALCVFYTLVSLLMKIIDKVTGRLTPEKILDRLLTNLTISYDMEKKSTKYKELPSLPKLGDS